MTGSPEFETVAPTTLADFLGRRQVMDRGIGDVVVADEEGIVVVPLSGRNRHTGAPAGSATTTPSIGRS